jgi:hypothetical protein
MYDLHDLAILFQSSVQSFAELNREGTSLTPGLSSTLHLDPLLLQETTFP